MGGLGSPQGLCTTLSPPWTLGTQVTISVHPPLGQGTPGHPEGPSPHQPSKLSAVNAAGKLQGHRMWGTAGQATPHPTGLTWVTGRGTWLHPGAATLPQQLLATSQVHRGRGLREGVDRGGQGRGPARGPLTALRKGRSDECKSSGSVAGESETADQSQVHGTGEPATHSQQSREPRLAAISPRELTRSRTASLAGLRPQFKTRRSLHPEQSHGVPAPITCPPASATILR